MIKIFNQYTVNYISGIFDIILLNSYKEQLKTYREEWNGARYVTALDAIRAIRDREEGIALLRSDKLAAIASYAIRPNQNIIDLSWLASNSMFPYAGKEIIIKLARKAYVENHTLRIHSSKSALGYYKKIGLTAPDPTFPSLFELTPEQARNFK